MRILFLIFALSVFWPSQPVQAHDNWHIPRFQADITIQSDGKVKVVENISVDFEGIEKHGIYRDLPIIYQSSGETIYTDIQVQQVLQDNAPAKIETITNKANLRIRIGDPNQTITGPHSYRIEYLVIGVLRPFESYDELYWNVTGNAWEVPLDEASATVKVATGTILQASCYQGAVGVTEPCQQKAVDNQTTNFMTTRNLAMGEGLTVAVGYPTGLIPILKVEPPVTLTELLLRPTTLLFFLVITVIGVAWLIQQWRRKGRDAVGAGPVLVTIVPEYESPQGLRPAEIGVLVDERADTLDVTSTIIDLAVRGYLTITEEPKKWLFGIVDYVLNQTDKRADGLQNYEKKLYDALFAGDSTVKLSQLKNSFFNDLAQVKSQLYADATAKQFFTGNPEQVRFKYYGLAVVLLILGLALIFWGAGETVDWALGLGSGLSLFSIILAATAHAMPARTAQGRELFRQAKGYELFINTAERYRVRFAEKQNLFEQILPYAIVFGVTVKFAKAMETMAIKPTQPSWYYGGRPFQAVAFASDINSFSQSLSTAIASTPSSSGSGGGGFSGGGFGGGGGGGW